MADELEPELEHDSLVAQLIGDVLTAYDRLQLGDVQANRRDVVRTSFAAMEGLCWDLREHVRTGAAELGDLSPMTDIALRDQSYAVSDRGDVIEQPRHIPLPAAIRLAVRQAQSSNPDLAVDFAHPGWTALQRAIKVRNRITHPKTAIDLIITDDDLAALKAGLFWLLATVEYVMALMNHALKTWNDAMHVLLEQLKAGDGAALAEYHALLALEHSRP